MSFHRVNQEKKYCSVKKKKILLYFVTANFHVYGAAAKMKICYCLPFKYSLITLRFFKKNAKILASLRILIKTGFEPSDYDCIIFLDSTNLKIVWKKITAFFKRHVSIIL